MECDTQHPIDLKKKQKHADAAFIRTPFQQPTSHTQQTPLPSPPTEGEDAYYDEEEEEWEDEEDEDEELDEDAYAALEGLLLGEAGGE